MTMALPTRNGVGPSCIALPVGPWPTFTDFLEQRFPAIARAEWMARMLRGDVVDAHGVQVRPETPYQAHGKIYYYRSLPLEVRIPFDETVLYQDDLLVVVDKPHFLPVTPAGRYLQETLLVRLKRKLGIETLVPMHRIDRETAGLVLFIIQPATRDRYQALFRQRAVAKSYEAIAPWRAELIFPMQYASRLVPAATFMQMREAAGTANAETLIELLEVKGERARYRLHPRTGQRHQLRVQMAALGLPIENDRIYPRHHPEIIGSDGEVEENYDKPLQLLARSLEFSDPVSGAFRHFESRKNLEF